MWESMFLDSEGVFQWAGVAAIVSCLALFSSIGSIVVTYQQGKKTRKSSTLASLRIEELKAIRKEFSDFLLTVASISGKSLDKRLFHDVSSQNEAKSKMERILSHLFTLDALLYRETKHTVEFNEKVQTSSSVFKKIETIDDLDAALNDLTAAFKKYSNIEYKQIEEDI